MSDDTSGAPSGPWSGLGLQEPPVLAGTPGQPAPGGEQYDEMGQPLHGRSHFNKLQKFGEVWGSSAPLADKLRQSWHVANYMVPDAEQNRIEAQMRTGVIPASEGDRRVDQTEGSPFGAIAALGTQALGGSQRAQDLALGLGTASEGALMSTAAVRAPVPRYLNAQRPALEEPQAIPTMLSRWGPTAADVDSLVAEHSKSNPVPLTRPAARRILEQAQPFGTSVKVAGDNVPGPDVYFPGSSGTELQIKAAANPDQFEELVRTELRRQKSADQQGAPSVASPVIAIQVPAGTNPARLMGKLRNNFANYDVDKHSIVVVDTDGNVLIPKRRFPEQARR